jgi:thiamine biosynthesis protein ThiS
MTVTINGEERPVRDGITLAELLEEISLPSARVAVERNGTIVPRARFSGLALQDGDRLEIVHFVGGG